MKKLFIILMVSAFAMTSCSTVYKTATTHNVEPTIAAVVLSDLDVSNEKITYTLTPKARVRRGGLRNCINTAISEALALNGGDVLIETQQATITRGLYVRKIKSVTVTGYPAKYKNFRPADDKTLKEAVVNGNVGPQHIAKK
ncbi:MAG: hypothetical protein K2H63_10525 [Paramuribaculum sp.]|nr:hypothetical protein [Paramuribaculum sp.]